MGSLWEPYGKGVPFLGAPGNSLDIIVFQCHNANHSTRRVLMKIPGAASPPTVRYLLMSKAPGCTLPLGRRLWPDISVKNSTLHQWKFCMKDMHICYAIVCKALFFPQIFGDSSLVQWLVSLPPPNVPPPQ